MLLSVDLLVIVSYSFQVEDHSQFFPENFFTSHTFHFELLHFFLSFITRDRILRFFHINMCKLMSFKDNAYATYKSFVHKPNLYDVSNSDNLIQNF